MSNTLSSRIVPAQRGLTAGGILCVLSALSLALAACTSQPSAIDVPDQRAVASSSSSPPGEADALLVVDCLLPGRVKKLGRQLTYLTPRRPVKTSA